MLVKKITFEDYMDGHSRTEEFCFHVSESELSMLNYEIEGGLENYFNQIINAENNYEVVKLFKKLIDISYGVRSLDGKHFRKSEAALEDFKSTDAYNKLFMELATNDEEAVRFIKGILPSKMAAEINEKELNKPKSLADVNINA